MSYAAALRRALVARLKTDTVLGPHVFSVPPANVAPPVVIIGQFAAEPRESKTDRCGFWHAGVEVWARTDSALDLDNFGDRVIDALEARPLPSTLAHFSPPILVASADAFAPDAPGGAVLSRTLTFRIFAEDL